MWQGDDQSYRHCMHQSQVALAEGDLLHKCHSLYFNRNRDNENSSLPEKHREKCNTTISLYYIYVPMILYIVTWILYESFIRTCSGICFSTVESHQLHTRNSHSGSVATRSTRGREGGQQLPAMPLPLPWEIITVRLWVMSLKSKSKFLHPPCLPILVFHSYESLKSPLSRSNYAHNISQSPLP